jgi:RimJ/RimL family protein N-acetyltransferase
MVEIAIRERADTLDGYEHGVPYRKFETHPGTTYPAELITPFRLKPTSLDMRARAQNRSDRSALPQPESIGDDETPVVIARPTVPGDQDGIKELMRHHITPDDYRTRFLHATGYDAECSEDAMRKKYGPWSEERQEGLDYRTHFAGVAVLPGPDGGERVLGTVHAWLHRPSGMCEVSFIVDSYLQGRGIAGALWQMLRAWANANAAVQVLHADVMPKNGPMKAAFDDHWGFDFLGLEYDTLAYEKHRPF